MRKERFWHSGRAWAALALCTTLLFCLSCSGPTHPSVTSTPSVQLTATALAPTPTPTPTPLAVLRVVELHIDQLDFLAPFARSTRPVHQVDFQAQNPAALLLTPQGSAEQHWVQFLKDSQTWILGNWNLPVFKEGQVKYQPAFNTPDFVQMMGWVDNEGNWLYHIPLQPGVEGKALVVFMKDGQLSEGLVDLNKNGQIDPGSIKGYWQKMPQEAVKAVMAKYEDAIYVTFWDKDGKQLVDERIKVCDLPPEPTPTPEPTTTLKPTETPVPPTKTPTKKPTERPTPVSQEVFKGNGWEFINDPGSLVTVGINRAFVPRLEQLIRENNANLNLHVFTICPIELGDGSTRMCVGLTNGTRGCPVRRIVTKNTVLVYPEPTDFYLLKASSEESGFPVERYFASWISQAITGRPVTEVLTLIDEFLSQKAVILKFK